MSSAAETKTVRRQNGAILWLVRDRQRLQTVVTLLVLILMLAVFGTLSQRFLTLSNFANVARNTAPLVIVACAMTTVMIARGSGSVRGQHSCRRVGFGGESVRQRRVGLPRLRRGRSVWRLRRIPERRYHRSNERQSDHRHAGHAQYRARRGLFDHAQRHSCRIAAKLGRPRDHEFWSVPAAYPHRGGRSGRLPLAVRVHEVRQHIYAVGGNEEAARLSGLHVERTLIILYVFCGAMAALAGIVLSSRVGSGDPNIGVGFELQVIAAVIIGGTSLSGGEGRVFGTVIGAFIVGVLSNGLNLAGVQPFWQYVAQGLVLIAAVVVDRRVNEGVLSMGNKAG